MQILFSCAWGFEWRDGGLATRKIKNVTNFEFKVQVHAKTQVH